MQSLGTMTVKISDETAGLALVYAIPQELRVRIAYRLSLVCEWTDGAASFIAPFHYAEYTRRLIERARRRGQLELLIQTVANEILSKGGI